MKPVKQIIKKIIYKSNILFKLYFKYFFDYKNDDINNFLNNKFKNKKIFFVQIGSNDGIRDDRLYKFIRLYKWGGVLIEPQKKTFEILKLNYSFSKNQNLIFENCAVAEEDKYMNLFKINEISDVFSAISSFKKEEVQKLIDSGYVERKAKENYINLPKEKKDWIISEKVKCVKINALLEKHKIENIDLLCIDTEGYDDKIVLSFPFEKIKPKIIIFEHTSLSAHKKEKIESFLNYHSYNLKIYTSDIIAKLN